MILKSVLLIIVLVFFAINMGGSGIAPSFAAVYGAKIISRKKATLLFSLFVLIGALTLGDRVAKTLSSGLIAKELFTPDIALIILSSATISLFTANLLKVPQSTSWVTVTATLGVALHLNNLNWLKTLHILGMWLVLPVVSFILTYLFFRYIYPPRSCNFRFHEKVHSWRKRIHYLSIASSCYVAFAIGANNVANVVGPLMGANLLSPIWGFLIVSVLFGLGGWVIKDRTMKTVGKDIVPLGSITSFLVSFITASLLICASIMGFPQSLVQLSTLAIMAVGTIKHECVLAVKEHAVKRTFIVWPIAPLFSGLLSFLFSSIFEV